MTSTSAAHPRVCASSSMRPILGSSGSRASRRPIFVRSPPGIGGAELAQQPQAVVDVAPVRRIDERETLHVLHPQRQHAQQHRREVCTLDLGLRVGGPRRKPDFVIEPDAHPGAGPPAPPGALIRRGPRDRFHRQPLHPGAVRIPAHPGGARVDDEADARYRQRRLRDVGREHDAAPVVGSEQRLLMRRGHSGMEREELGVRQPEAPDPSLGLADLAALRTGRRAHRPARRAAPPTPPLPSPGRRLLPPRADTGSRWGRYGPPPR